MMRLAAAASLALLLGCSPARDATRPPDAAGAAGRRVLLVGLDAADWSVVDPLVAAGRLPTFARLRAAGRTATLISEPPLLSPILWTTIATGRPPDEHGVLDFMVDLPGGGQGPVDPSIGDAGPVAPVRLARAQVSAVVGWWARGRRKTFGGT